MTPRAVLALAAGAVIGLSAATGAASSLGLSSQAFTSYRTCTMTATPATTTAVVDSTVRQGSASSNFGTAAAVEGASGSGANRRIYIKFDLAGCVPAIPTSATVRLATLRLYLTAVPAVCRTLDVFAVTGAWTETAITWNNQPFGTTLNNPASATRSTSFTVGSPVGCTNRVAATYATGPTTTADVSRFISGASSNLGWMIRDDVEGSATLYTSSFASKEAAVVAQAPQLVVTYVATP